MKALYGAVFGAACVLAGSATTASAEIACNDEGDCWHITKIHKYRPEFKITIYPDDWRWEERESRITGGANTKAAAIGGMMSGSILTIRSA